MSLNAHVILALIGSWLILGILTGPRSALGQTSTDQNEDLNLAPNGRWAVGLQLMPIAGPSVRVAITPRVSVQAAGVPATFREKGFQGIFGGRVLYKLVNKEHYNTYASVAMSMIFDKTAQSYIDMEPTFELQKMPLLAFTFGGEGALGSNLSISGEIGASQLRSDIGTFTQFAYGIGLHYYW